MSVEGGAAVTILSGVLLLVVVVMVVRWATRNAKTVDRFVEEAEERAKAIEDRLQKWTGQVPVLIRPNTAELYEDGEFVVRIDVYNRTDFSWAINDVRLEEVLVEATPQRSESKTTQRTHRDPRGETVIPAREGHTTLVFRGRVPDTFTEDEVRVLVAASAPRCGELTLTGPTLSAEQKRDLQRAKRPIPAGKVRQIPIVPMRLGVVVRGIDR